METNNGGTLWPVQKESEPLSRYKEMSDEQLLDIIRLWTEELGHPPTKNDVSYAFYFKQRLGPWNRILEQAGVKEVSAGRKQKLKARQARQKG